MHVRARGRPVFPLFEAPAAHPGAKVLLAEETVAARRRVRVAQEGGHGVAQGDEGLEAVEEQGQRGEHEGDEVEAQHAREENPVEVDRAGLCGRVGRLCEAVRDL